MTQETNQRKRAAIQKKPGTWLWMILLSLVAAVAVMLFFSLKEKAAAPMESGNSMPLLEVETPVGKLVFPSEWAQDVRIEKTSVQDPYTVSFYGFAEDQEILLFAFSFGSGTGYRIGSVPNADGTPQTIWLNISRIEALSSWSEEEKARINGLQECVNDLIYQFHQMDGFRESN